MHVFVLLEAHISRKKVYQRGLTLKNEFLLVLMRHLLLEDLAYRFNLAKSTVSSIFDTWIDVMAVQLSFLIKIMGTKRSCNGKYASYLEKYIPLPDALLIALKCLLNSLSLFKHEHRHILTIRNITLSNF